MEKKEAMKILKDFHDKSALFSVRAALDTIIPELKESEDERIRKELLDYCKNRAEKYPNDPKYRNISAWIAWLEKQGEQTLAEKVEPKFKVGDTVTVKPMSCHGKVFKGEPFKIVDIIEDNYVSDDGKTYSISLQDGWELVEQKPAIDIDIPFGAKDSELMEATYNIPKGFHAEIEGNKVVIKKGEQKPAWSEEDEKKLNYLIALLQNSTMHNSALRTANEEIENWLKSLRPQNTWKPSKEQITALQTVYDWHKSRFPQLAGIESLINELKKLK